MKSVYPVRIPGRRRIVFLSGDGFVVLPIGVSLLRSDRAGVRASGKGIVTKHFIVNAPTVKEWKRVFKEAAIYIDKQRTASTFTINREVDGFSKVDEDHILGSRQLKSGSVALVYSSAVVRRSYIVCSGFHEAKEVRENLVNYTLAHGRFKLGRDLTSSTSLSDLIPRQVSL